MRELILVLGGARSGKSSFAETIVSKKGGKDVTYIATAAIKDEEMEERVRQHRESRPSKWTTIEAEKEVSKALASLKQGQVVLLDCLTVLISNLLLQQQDLKQDDYDFTVGDREDIIMQEVENILTVAKERKLNLVIVSNQVGQGLVPAYKAGRVYRDLVGRANQLVASKADKVYISYAGLPVEIKELAEKNKAEYN